MAKKSIALNTARGQLAEIDFDAVQPIDTRTYDDGGRMLTSAYKTASAKRERTTNDTRSRASTSRAPRSVTGNLS